MSNLELVIVREHGDELEAHCVFGPTQNYAFMDAVRAIPALVIDKPVRDFAPLTAGFDRQIVGANPYQPQGGQDLPWTGVRAGALGKAMRDTYTHGHLDEYTAPIEAYLRAMPASAVVLLRWWP